MKQYKSFSVDEYGQVGFSGPQLVNLLKSGVDISELSMIETEDTQLFDRYLKHYDRNDERLSSLVTPEVSVEDWDKLHQAIWNIPDEYKNLDVFEYLTNKCQTQEQVERVCVEWLKYEEYDLIPMLRCLVYLIDTFRKNDVVWGVGRGSSCSSYILYLIGMHRVDPLKYDLDFSEFLS